MDITHYLLYFSISLVASVSFGPSVLLAASNGINFGRKLAFFGVLGHVSAVLLLAILSMSGVGALLIASETAFNGVKFLGAGYLVYLGIKIWRSDNGFSFHEGIQATPAKRHLFRQSFVLGMSNPKALVFFSSLFPQFIVPDAPLLPQFLILAGTSLVNAFTFTFAYAVVAFKCKHALLTRVNGKGFARVTGSLFIGFAAMLATAS